MATKILFFDDEKRIAEILQKNLELYGYEVTLVSTISEFFAEINNIAVKYNLVLMDIMAPMPNADEMQWFSKSEIENMNEGISIGEILADKIRTGNETNVGEVLAEKIRGIAKYANVPILFYSAKGRVKEYSNAKFLPKPALAKDIVEEIKKLLSGGE